MFARKKRCLSTISPLRNEGDFFCLLNEKTLNKLLFRPTYRRVLRSSPEKEETNGIDR